MRPAKTVSAAGARPRGDGREPGACAVRQLPATQDAGKLGKNLDVVTFVVTLRAGRYIPPQPRTPLFGLKNMIYHWCY